jgi:sulfopyruvate decarboxylase subunit alpha
MNVQAPVADKPRLSGAGIIAAIKAAGIGHVISVPDIVTAGSLLEPISRDPDFRLIRVCKEDEAIAIAAALSYADKRALVLIQHTGMLYATNAIRAVAAEYRHPVCMMIGLLGHETDKPGSESHRFGVRIVEPILDAMGIKRHLINADAHVAAIAPAIEEAYRTPMPVALLIGRSPAR